MSFNSPKDHFEDIQIAIALIQEFTNGSTYDSYKNDLKTKAAVERQFQILSEAAYRLGPDAELLCPDPDWTGLRGMGNILRHAYQRIDDDTIWKAVMIELPPLKVAVAKAIATHFPAATA